MPAWICRRQDSAVGSLIDIVTSLCDATPGNPPCLPYAPLPRLPGSGLSSNVLRGWSPTVPIRHAHNAGRAQQRNIRPETGSSDVGLRIRPEPYHRKQFQLTPFAVQRQAVSGALPADSDLGQNNARRAPISKCPIYRGDARSAAASSGGE